MFLGSNRCNTRVNFLSCFLVFSANMAIPSAILFVPGVSASIVWIACCNSSAAEFTPKISRLKRFMRVSDSKTVINRVS